ncbi:MAG: hypothetical protein BM557_07915 [Flavobacterium sp. MedPE-SWcel]|nr:MAG: hypothetical protein BM557_07915 [Flavobacterium sp. MedPE-SWcel]
MKIYTILILLCISCSSIGKKSSCNENQEFKTEFFKNIKNIEDQMTKVKNESFDSSLKFISKYTHVSFNSMNNYARTYPLGIFEKDKEGWLKWYEENKCNNIQFK